MLPLSTRVRILFHPALPGMHPINQFEPAMPAAG